MFGKYGDAIKLPFGILVVLLIVNFVLGIIGAFVGAIPVINVAGGILSLLWLGIMALITIAVYIWMGYNAKTNLGFAWTDSLIAGFIVSIPYEILHFLGTFLLTIIGAALGGVSTTLGSDDKAVGMLVGGIGAMIGVGFGTAMALLVAIVGIILGPILTLLGHLLGKVLSK
ncbi:MAG: hypothetical protein QW035_01355 [Candidatus Anstonellales archaeon]